jgi:hypothetical protein
LTNIEFEDRESPLSLADYSFQSCSSLRGVAETREGKTHYVFTIPETVRIEGVSVFQSAFRSYTNVHIVFEGENESTALNQTFYSANKIVSVENIPVTLSSMNSTFYSCTAALVAMSKVLLRNIELKGVASDILIDGEYIADVLPAGSVSGLDAEVVDCSGKAAVPGFVNMHTHAGMMMMKGVGEDIAFHEWIDRIWQIETRLDEELVYQSTRLACLEMIKTGTTTFNDHYWHMPEGYKAALEMGIRGVHAYVILDRNDPEESERQKIQCQEMYEVAKAWGVTSTFSIAIHAIYSVREEMLYGQRISHAKGD